MYNDPRRAFFPNIIKTVKMTQGAWWPEESIIASVLNAYEDLSNIRRNFHTQNRQIAIEEPAYRYLFNLNECQTKTSRVLTVTGLNPRDCQVHQLLSETGNPWLVELEGDDTLLTAAYYEHYLGYLYPGDTLTVAGTLVLLERTYPHRQWFLIMTEV